MDDRTCNRCNQPLTTAQKKYCSHACANKSSMQDLAQRNRELDWKQCESDGCTNRARTRSAALCPKHYHRAYRTGSLELLAPPPRWVDLRGQRFGTLTVMERVGSSWRCLCDCGRERILLAGDLNRTREGISCTQRGCKKPPTPRLPNAEYRAAHTRIMRDKGKASQHSCVDCGTTAQQWSYDHQDTNELNSSSKGSLGMPYSLDPNHYQPRCTKCHKAFDHR